MGRQSHEFVIRSIKLLDIGYVTAIYLLVAVFLSNIIDRALTPVDESMERQKSLLRRTMELIGITWLLVATIYIVRNLVELIPSPFHGIAGFDHFRLKELKFAAIFIFIFLFLQTHFRDKLRFYSEDMGAFILSYSRKWTLSMNFAMHFLRKS